MADTWANSGELITANTQCSCQCEDGTLLVDLDATDTTLDTCLKDFINNKVIVHYDSVSDLPAIGNNEILYVINNEDLYIWDNTLRKYVLLNGSQAKVGDGKFTLNQNNQLIGQFTANQFTDVSVNMTTPTKVSELDNDSKYVTETSTETIDIDFSHFFD